MKIETNVIQKVSVKVDDKTIYLQLLLANGSYVDIPYELDTVEDCTDSLGKIYTSKTKIEK